MQQQLVLALAEGIIKHEPIEEKHYRKKYEKFKDVSEKVANTAPEKEPDMNQQDLMFCEKALEESNIIEAKSNQDKLVLSDILSKKE